MSRTKGVKNTGAFTGTGFWEPPPFYVGQKIQIQVGDLSVDAIVTKRTENPDGSVTCDCQPVGGGYASPRHRGV